MHFLNTTTDFLQRPLRPIADMMSRVGWDPFFTKMHDVFTVPVGEGWSKDGYNLRFVIPGIERNEFDLRFHGDRLVLRGQRTKPDALESSDHFQFAMPYGHFERSVDLPHGLDLEKMTATFHHGLLDVRIPALANLKARVVPISMPEFEKGVTPV